MFGGLMSYRTSLVDAYHQVGVYTGRILAGEKPMSCRWCSRPALIMVVNLRTAEALGVTIPPAVLATADEVIE